MVLKPEPHSLRFINSKVGLSLSRGQLVFLPNISTKDDSGDAEAFEAGEPD